MGSLMQVMKEDKGARRLFVMFTIMIILGIACFVFAIFHPQPDNSGNYLKHCLEYFKLASRDILPSL